MSSKPPLRVDWCSHEAAKYAVEHWHYSRRMPVGKMSRLGVWESQRFVGVILFARGANHTIGMEYGLTTYEVCELVRVALTNHVTPVSRILAIAIKLVCDLSDGLRLIVSYADSEQGHHGGIYQASNWTYVGRGQGSTEFWHEGRWKHNREVTAGAFGKPRRLADYKALPTRKTIGKHKYLYPLDDAMRRQIAPLAKPYPKRPRAESIDGDAPAFHAGEGGSIPTSALHLGAD